MTATCPPGTVQVGIVTVKYPQGDKSCVICKDCEPVEDLDCYDCCTPALLALGYRCLPAWDHLIKAKSNGALQVSYRITSPTITFSPNPNNFMYATYATAIRRFFPTYYHIPEETVYEPTIFSVDIWDNYYVETVYLGEACYPPAP